MSQWLILNPSFLHGKKSFPPAVNCMPMSVANSQYLGFHFSVLNPTLNPAKSPFTLALLQVMYMCEKPSLCARVAISDGISMITCLVGAEKSKHNRIRCIVENGDIGYMSLYDWVKSNLGGQIRRRNLEVRLYKIY